jgi:hypothetical protein
MRRYGDHLTYVEANRLAMAERNADPQTVEGLDAPVSNQAAPSSLAPSPGVDVAR